MSRVGEQVTVPVGLLEEPMGQVGQLDSADFGWAVPAGQSVHEVALA